MASSRSNEEIVEELTKDLHETNDTRTHSFESGDNATETNLEETASEIDNHGESGSSKSSNNTENVDDAEFIDEDSLKDRDSLLTEEQMNVSFPIFQKFDGSSIKNSFLSGISIQSSRGQSQW